MAATVDKSAPAGEKGTANPAAGWGWNFGSAGTGLTDLTGTDRDQADAWRWPQSNDTAETMLNDAQIVALTSAIMLPAQYADISLDPNGMDPEMAAKLAADLDIPVDGVETPAESTGRRRDAFNHRKHFGRALSALAYGHAVFEIVGEIAEDGMWRMKALAPRPAWSIVRFLVDKQGRLQTVETQGISTSVIPLDASRLSVWTWGGDVGDPRGKSILRSLYRPWMLKDRGMRIDMIAHERNAMGIPIGWLPEGGTPADRDELLDLLSSIAAGEDAALVVPHGGDIKFRGVEGLTSNVLESVKFMNEEMGRALLGMIVNAGQTGQGTYSSSDNFMDLLALFHKVVLDWYCDLLTEQVVERWVTFNLGADAPSARVIWTPTDDSKETGLAPAMPVVAPAAAARSRKDAMRHKSAGSPLQRTAFASVLPDRPLRRDPFPHEIMSGANFKTMEADHVKQAASLMGEMTSTRVELGGVAASAVENLGTAFADSPAKAVLAENALTSAMNYARDTISTEKITKALEAAHAQGVAQVVSEAAAQGVEASVTASSYSEVALGEARDLIGRSARQVTETALNSVRVGGVDAKTVAGVITGAVAGLSDALLNRAAEGAIARAELTGRTDQIREAPPTNIYASELLDANTCDNCEVVDGTEYASLDDALGDYPSGGYMDCQGGEACRGTLVAVYGTEGGEA